MNKFRIFVLSAAVVLAASVAFAEDRVVAKYNGKDCHKSEVEAWVKASSDGKLPNNKTDLDDLDKNLKAQLINEYVSNKMLLEAAEKSNKNTPEYKHKLDILVNSAKIAIYLDNYAKQKLSSSMIKEEYSNYVKELKAHDDLKISHILIKSEDEAKKIFEEINSKKISFEEAVKKYSLDDATKKHNGEMGTVSYGRVSPELAPIEQAAYTLKKGEVSKPVQTQFGWHIIKVLDAQKAKIPTFEEAKAWFEAEILMRLKKTHIAELFNSGNVDIFTEKSVAESKK